MEVLRYLVIAWGAVGAVLLVLLGYRGTLTRYEEDQIFLNDAVSVESQEQGEIQRKLLILRPYLVVMLWTIGTLTAVILGLFVKDLIAHLA
jgi:undecaprenyl pyrophosphate phosphatase UppP